MGKQNTCSWLLLGTLGTASIVHATATGTNGNNSHLPMQLSVRGELTTRLANVHVSTSRAVPGRVSFTHGSCTAQSQEDSHHVVSSVESGVGGAAVDSDGDARLVWIMPEDAPDGGCISAWNEKGALVGRSEPLELPKQKRKPKPKPKNKNKMKRQASSDHHIAMNKATGFDALGQWFDGVRFLKEKQPGAVDVGAAKKKDIAIVGAGLSGLTTYLLLHQAGFTNLQVLEASNRLGGRVHTQYLTGGPRDYSYQELGAMRLAVDYVDPDSKKKYNISDTQLVFSLINELNRLNGDKSPAHKIELIDWIETSDNGLQYFDGIRTPSGLPPTVKQVQDNPDLYSPQSSESNYDAATRATNKKLQDSLPGNDFLVQMARNMYKAHRAWNDGGLDGGGQPGDRWSEFAFISQYLKGSLNSTDVLDREQDPQGSFWEYMYDLFYDSADSWVTVDGGLGRLPLAFQPLLQEKEAVRFNTTIERIEYSESGGGGGGGGSKRLTLQYKRHFRDSSFQNSSHDYAIISAPFTVVRQWRLPRMATTMRDAIENLIYDGNCKVALEYSHRFWETMKNPIVGSCSTTTDIPGIGMVCYPSYNINASDAGGPASILASYIDASSDHEVSRMQTMSAEEHVQYVLNAMCEIHGEETRKLYTGKWARKCWDLDPYAVGAFANPSAGQHELYMPMYMQVHKNMIFIGEHTSYTHGWISSALDSGIRGAVQMMLELGLVDEAKAAVKKWMVPWIQI
ncbi:hypothetical protein E4U43_004625 [Claviceps pusilla]|uniref:Amine oxidase domain-containing protein n=1 Tax=Claviceps pusilla TaxID=123648 RepID=A0A9P7N348_9HYPO|nr:hypothetical protein E4U43_004625 [Claviceps pusilla]